ncbi:hypothetical protein R5R35_008066 [Gryllus longicercus]|uniref:Lipase domain-containing protein n=1 Tax=Gryllus longicercus TaxID=2509291 RepID=A0AAN9ZCG7_9ORTH
MTSVCSLLLIVTLASQCAFAQLTEPTNITWPSVTSSGTCDNSTDDLITSNSSSDPFSTILQNTFNFVNSTIICKTGCEEAAKIALIEIYYFYGPTETDYEVVNLNNFRALLTGGHWNFSRNTTCFFPGYLNDAKTDYTLTVVNAYLSNNSTNLLVVVWPNRQEYSWMVCQMPYLAQRLAKAFDDFSTASSGKVTTMVFVGHSVGAHLCAYTARLLVVLRIPLLAALDPANPLFSPYPWRCQEGIGASDAECVVTLHTDIGRLGTPIAIGPVDCYANGGTYRQPGCTEYDMNPTGCADKFACSHTKALLIWCYAVRYPGSIIARRCSSYSADRSGMCDSSETIDITSLNSCRIPGPYYFNTTNI